MPTDIEIYCGYMAEIRDRVNVIENVLNGVLAGIPPFVATEVVNLQFRKVLELIAFSTLAANKEAYASAHENFSKHWRAKKILEEISKLNPDFYPMALDPPEEVGPGRKHFPRPDGGFLTHDEFVALYDSASGVLHTSNPYATNSASTSFQYSTSQWAGRIQRLLGWHRVQLISGSLWIVNIPNQGDVQTWPAAPV
ncbi:MAG: hypothetical protein QM808_17830 [Steroidobacteraceae bacterium]